MKVAGLVDLRLGCTQISVLWRFLYGETLILIHLLLQSLSELSGHGVFVGGICKHLFLGCFHFIIHCFVYVFMFRCITVHDNAESLFKRYGHGLRIIDCFVLYSAT